jgi:hypothetical protein
MGGSIAPLLAPGPTVVAHYRFVNPWKQRVSPICREKTIALRMACPLRKEFFKGRNPMKGDTTMKNLDSYPTIFTKRARVEQIAPQFC